MSTNLGGNPASNIPLPVATLTTDGIHSWQDKLKLSGIADGATANLTDVQLKDRTNHTGSQLANTITGLAAVATSGLKSDVGLSNVDNTSDLNKPVSTAMQTVVNGLQPTLTVLAQNVTGTLTSWNTVVSITATANMTITLPPCAGNVGKQLVFKRMDATAVNVTLVAGAGDTLQVPANALNGQNTSVRLVALTASSSVQLAGISNNGVPTPTATLVSITDTSGPTITLPLATTTLAGVMSAADKVALAAASVQETVQSLNATGTITAWNSLVIVGAVAPTANIILTLPVSTSQTPRRIKIKRVDNTAFTLTLQPNALDGIEGGAVNAPVVFPELQQQHGFVELFVQANTIIRKTDSPVLNPIRLNNGAALARGVYDITFATWPSSGNFEFYEDQYFRFDFNTNNLRVASVGTVKTVGVHGYNSASANVATLPVSVPTVLGTQGWESGSNSITVGVFTNISRVGLSQDFDDLAIFWLESSQVNVKYKITLMGGFQLGVCVERWDFSKVANSVKITLTN